YLKATSPTLAIISAGINNQYGHPHKEVLDYLKILNIPYLATYDNGMIICESDAIKILCK
ncbi:MBL fold metallo-hydrolase, partial [Candidatus Nomurabacteria bacterium]|nr:MBL fold metallo-hydrolase [Candidatus Nomurabacteria bacterium]